MIDFERILKRISYKPNWVFTLRPDWAFPSVRWSTLVIIMHVPNIRDPRQTIPVEGHFRIDPRDFADEKHFIQFVRDKCIEIENHELDEWFCVDERQIKNPHGGEPLFIPNPRRDTQTIPPRRHGFFEPLDGLRPPPPIYDDWHTSMIPYLPHKSLYPSPLDDKVPNTPSLLPDFQKDILEKQKEAMVFGKSMWEFPKGLWDLPKKKKKKRQK